MLHIGEKIRVYFAESLDTIIALQYNERCYVEINAPDFFVKGTPSVLQPKLTTELFYIFKNVTNVINIPVKFSTFYFRDMGELKVEDMRSYYLLDGRKVPKLKTDIK